MPRAWARATRSEAEGPRPQSAPPLESETRSLAKVTLARSHPRFSSPTRFSAGMRTSSRKTSLKRWTPVISTMGRTSTPGASIGQMKYEIPRCLGASGSVRAIRIPNLETWAIEVQTFWPLITYESPSLTAVVRSDARSDPAPGSLNSWHQNSAPERIGSR